MKRTAEGVVEPVDKPDAKNKFRAKKPGDDEWSYFKQKSEAEEYASGSESKGLFGKLKGKIKNLVEEQKKFFREGMHEAGSEVRRNLGDAIKDKAKGVVKALKKEGETFKSAASGLKALAKGEGISADQKKAVGSVALKAVGAVGATALGGGLGAPGLVLAKQLGVQIASGMLKGSVAKSVLFASYRDRCMALRISRRVLADEDDLTDEDAVLKFLEEFADRLKEQDLDTEEWETIISGLSDGGSE